MNILPVNRDSAIDLARLPAISGEIPTSQALLDDIQVADFASWLDDHLNDLEFKFQEYWTHDSTLNALFHGTQRR